MDESRDGYLASDDDYGKNPMTEYIEGEDLKDYYRRMAVTHTKPGDYFWTCMGENQNVNRILNKFGKVWKCKKDPITGFIKVTRLA